MGGWWMGGGWVADGGSLAPRDGRVSSSKNETPLVCFLLHTRSSRTNLLTAPRVPGVLLYVLLHCCTAVCSKGLVGGWVEGALRRPWWVGGPFRTWESFFVLWEMNFFLVSKITASHWCLGVPPSPLLHSSALYYRTYCRTAVLLPCYYFVFLVLTYRE